MAKQKQPTIPRFGKQPPLYRFFLNPYQDMRWTKCPQCDQKMHQRKLPLVIHHVEPISLFSLNKTCRYCPHCDLLIAHQNDIERILASYFNDRQPKVIGKDYLVIGTLEKMVWKRGVQQPLLLQETLDALHDFKEVVTFQVTGGWMPPSGSSRPSAQE